MKIKTLFFSIVMLSTVCTTNNGTVYAISNDTNKTFEEEFTELGYKDVHHAIKDFETYTGQDIKLPLKVPPITFTHCFGKFNDVPDNVKLEIRCLNDKLGKNHYKMYVRPLEDKLELRNNVPKKIYELTDGSEAKLINLEIHEALLFESNNLQYMLSIDKRVVDKVTPNVLVEIANSIDN